MACPFFWPTEPHSYGACARSTMLPLGDLWTGTCHAAPGSQRAAPVDNPALLHTCNLGYARSTCPHFPVATSADAIRFTISRDEGDTLRIYYVMERDHHPLAHGPLEYSRTRASLLNPPPDPILARQAAAYAETYLSRLGEAHATR